MDDRFPAIPPAAPARASQPLWTRPAPGATSSTEYWSPPGTAPSAVGDYKASGDDPCLDHVSGAEAYLLQPSRVAQEEDQERAQRRPPQLVPLVRAGWFRT